MVLDNMVASEQLDESLREKVRDAVLKRHHHQNEKKLSNRIPLVRSFADIGKKHSDPLLLERNGEIFYCAWLFLSNIYFYILLNKILLKPPLINPLFPLKNKKWRK